MVCISTYLQRSCGGWSSHTPAHSLNAADRFPSNRHVAHTGLEVHRVSSHTAQNWSSRWRCEWLPCTWNKWPLWLHHTSLYEEWTACWAHYVLEVETQWMIWLHQVELTRPYERCTCSCAAASALPPPLTTQTWFALNASLRASPHMLYWPSGALQDKYTLCHISTHMDYANSNFQTLA